MAKHPFNLSCAHVAALMLTTAALLQSPGTKANVILPVATGGVTFTAFRGIDPDGNGFNIGDGCNQLFFPAGSASCSGQVFRSGGDSLVVTGAANGSGSISGGPNGGAPTVSTHLDVNGGDTVNGIPDSGAGNASVSTTAQYYVTVVSITPPPVPTNLVPLSFTDAGSVTGFASNTDSVGGDASTGVSSFNGTITGTFFDDVSPFAANGSMSQVYGKTHSVVFQMSTDPVAEVDLEADCSFGSIIAGFGLGNCDATADPFIGFDQNAFDSLMGVNTFDLSDFFEIVISPGFDAPSPGKPGLPEPASLALLATGAASVGLARKRKSG